MTRIGFGLMALLIMAAGAGCDKRIREAGASPRRSTESLAPATPAADVRLAASQS